LTEEVVEKDYVLGWLLWGIGTHRALRNHWIDTQDALQNTAA
jgi:hypothetical protein